MRSIQILGYGFTASILLVQRGSYWIVSDAAPIVHYLIGQEEKAARKLCVGKGWSITELGGSK